MNFNVLLNENTVLDELLISTSMLSNNSNSNWRADSAKLISFICKAYKLNIFSEEIIELITNKINNLSLINEYKGLRREHQFDDEYTELDSLYNLKGRALLQLNHIDKKLAKMGLQIVNELSYDDNFNYIPRERFNYLLKASSYGIPQIVCQIGLMYATGIGTSISYEKALLRFKQALFWGHYPAAKYISYIYELNNDLKKKTLYSDIYEICDAYLFDGLLSIPKDKRDRYSNDANEIFELVSSIYHEIVTKKSEMIDYAFLEVIFSNSISFIEKLKLIKCYNDVNWRTILITKKQAPVFKNLLKMEES